MGVNSERKGGHFDEKLKSRVNVRIGDSRAILNLKKVKIGQTQEEKILLIPFNNPNDVCCDCNKILKEIEQLYLNQYTKKFISYTTTYSEYKIERKEVMQNSKVSLSFFSFLDIL